MLFVICSECNSLQYWVMQLCLYQRSILSKKQETMQSIHKIAKRKGEVGVKIKIAITLL